MLLFGQLRCSQMCVSPTKKRINMFTLNTRILISTSTTNMWDTYCSWWALQDHSEYLEYKLIYIWHEIKAPWNKTLLNLLKGFSLPFKGFHWPLDLPFNLTKFGFCSARHLVDALTHFKRNENMEHMCITGRGTRPLTYSHFSSGQVSWRAAQSTVTVNTSTHIHIFRPGRVLLGVSCKLNRNSSWIWIWSWNWGDSFRLVVIRKCQHERDKATNA